MPRRSARPRLYHVAPRHTPSLAQPPGDGAWASVLERAESLGFDHILLGSVWQSAPADPCAADDPDAVLPVLGGGTTADYVAALAEAARRDGLGVWMDVAISHAALEGALHRAHPDWFDGQAPESAALDPRRDPQERRAVPVVVRHGHAGVGFVAYWQDWFSRMAAAGATGFRVLLPHGVPGADWQALIDGVRANHPDIVFSAWTPGLWPTHLDDLAQAGFDAVYSSLPWWNLADDWYIGEHERLVRVGAVIAPVANPESAQPTAPAAVLRALRSAAELADGVLLPHAADPIDAGGAEVAAGIAKANLALARRAPGQVRQLRRLTGDTAAVTLIHRKDVTGDTLVAINPSLDESRPLDWTLARSRLAKAVPEAAAQRQPELPAAAVVAISLAPASPVVTIRKRVGHARQREALEQAMALPRVIIQDVMPSTPDETHLIKRVVGEPVTVRANIFMDGHDVLAAQVLWRSVDDDSWEAVPMRALGNDAWTATFSPQRVGRHEFTVQAWRDVFGTYRSELAKKHAAGVDVHLEVIEGRQLLASAGVSVPDDVDADTLLGEAVAQAMARADVREFEARWPVAQALSVERRAARFASWYELFPRSQSGDPSRHGTFHDVIGRLPYVRDMGFDVLYFPPIHPIGRKNRKGRNNSLTALDGDPGSPYAIGAEEGGHDALHPELGTLEDFRALVKAAREHDLELALDFAIQCSPDHPWLRDHPDWFAWRADGSMRYAENPPKKYEDIVNVDFYGTPAKRGRSRGNGGLWLALRDVVLFWCNEGVRTFRVDNPHTKPLPFWQWMIAEVQARYPDAIFLSEAFTRPNMMYRLAKIGFSQSYTYFTWRDTKAEMAEYLTEVGNPPVSDIFRPNFFVNTPDINPRFLQRSGRPGFLIRAALATTLSGLWGMYSGFELCEGTPVPGKEEYLDSEKYEIRAWDWDRPGHIRGEIAQLNRIRRANPALHSHTGVQFHPASGDHLLFFSKRTPEGDNVLLIAINMDPTQPQTANVELPMWLLGLPDDGTLHAEDLLHGDRFAWHGKHQQVTLSNEAPYAIWRVRA